MFDQEMIKSEAKKIFSMYRGKYDAIDMVCLSTADGFPVISVAADGLTFEKDTMSAASSTLYSVSDAISRQILMKPFRIAFIESEMGNIAFVSIEFGEHDFVLAMSANDSMNIGQLRVLIHRICDELRSSVTV